MMLKSLSVEGLGMFRGTFALNDLAPGLNVVYGPNEAGKSTLFLAVQHALFTPYRASGAELESLRPWDTDLRPRVVVELENRGNHYRLEKRFLRGASCVLQEWRHGSWHPLADGDAADDRVRALLGGQKPGRGAARQEHWGLAHLLWVPQGELAPPVVAGPALGRLQTILGRIALDAGETRLAGLAEKSYGEVFTPSRGEYRKSSDVRRLAAEVERLRQELETVQARHSQAEIHARELSAAEATLSQLLLAL